MAFYWRNQININYLEDKMRDLQRVLLILEKYSIRTDYIQKSLIDTYSELSSTRKQQEIIQKKCKHSYVHDGWDSHYNYYKCDKCGYIEER